MNCTDFNITNIHTVYESCKDDAREMNLAVTGSELVGLVPLECFLDIADFYMKKENLFIVDERQKVGLVIDRLGLHSCKRFDPDQMIIDYKCKQEEPPLISLTVKDFVCVLGARTAAPGGGSASALVASMGTCNVCVRVGALFLSLLCTALTYSPYCIYALPSHLQVPRLVA